MGRGRSLGADAMRGLYVIPLILLFILTYPSTVKNPTYTYQFKTHEVIKIAMVRTQVKQSSRGGNREYIGKFEATAYNLTSTTATGQRTRVGIVAVDPRVIPLGTRLYVEGYGYAVAEDTGEKIVNKKIDVWIIKKEDCYKWGRRKVNVWILK